MKQLLLVCVLMTTALSARLALFNCTTSYGENAGNKIILKSRDVLVDLDYMAAFYPEYQGSGTTIATFNHQGEEYNVQLNGSDSEWNINQVYMTINKKIYRRAKKKFEIVSVANGIFSAGPKAIRLRTNSYVKKGKRQGLMESFISVGCTFKDFVARR